MNFCILITGCQYNYYDAKRIAQQLTKMGYSYVTSEEDADIIIMIACSVRQKPVDRFFGKVKNWRKLPRHPKVYVSGCLLPLDSKKVLPKIDGFIDANDLENQINKYFNVINCEEESEYNFLPGDAKENTAFIPIMQGCNNFCSYCSVPYTRGREISRDEKEIIDQIKEQLKKGRKHILLLGQNVNSYKISEDKIAFPKLLKLVDKIDGDFDFNFVSANPHDFSDKLVETLPKLKKWERQLHLPVQSGDDEILRKMNRKYTSKNFLELVNKIRKNSPNLPISTDIIVGFPTETEENFNNTVDLCNKIGFSKVFAAMYSPRPGTLAQKKFIDDVPEDVKKRRWKMIDQMINHKHNI